MSSLYINTKLKTTITLNPQAFDNNIYTHLKNQLTGKVEGRCFGKYGYVVKVYEILERKDGVIVAENPMAAASFDVVFSARLCIPLKNKQIICQIKKLNKLFISLSSGPALKLIVTIDRINKNIFFVDQNRNLRYRKGEKSQVIVAGNFVRVTILSKTFNDMDTYIMALGYLEDMATDEQVKTFYSEEYEKETGKLVDFDEYIKQEDDETEIINDVDENDQLEPEEKAKDSLI